jgi:hypothetical protein
MTSKKEESAVLLTKLEYIRQDIEEIKTTLRSDYVKHAEFLPVRNLVYGLVGLILMAVVGALLGLVILK